MSVIAAAPVDELAMLDTFPEEWLEAPYNLRLIRSGRWFRKETWYEAQLKGVSKLPTIVGETVYGEAWFEGPMDPCDAWTITHHGRIVWPVRKGGSVWVRLWRGDRLCVNLSLIGTA